MVTDETPVMNLSHGDSHRRAKDIFSEGTANPDPWIMCRHYLPGHVFERWEKRSGKPWELLERREPRWVPPAFNPLERGGA